MHEPFAVDDSLATLLDRLRHGDEEAAREIVRDFEAEIHREVRLRLRDRRLRSLVDSDDVSQSVLGSFFERMARGEYDIDSADAIIRLLARLVRNKVADVSRRAYAERRDRRRTQRLGKHGQDGTLEAAGPGPHEALEAAELLTAFRERMTPLEIEIAALRVDGLGWEDVAEQLGGTADGIRMRMQRAMLRVSLELGLGAS